MYHVEQTRYNIPHYDCRNPACSYHRRQPSLCFSATTSQRKLQQLQALSIYRLATRGICLHNRQSPQVGMELPTPTQPHITPPQGYIKKSQHRRPPATIHSPIPRQQCCYMVCHTRPRERANSNLHSRQPMQRLHPCQREIGVRHNTAFLNTQQPFFTPVLQQRSDGHQL